MPAHFLASLPAIAVANGGNVTLTFSNFRDEANAAVTLKEGDLVVAAFAFGNTTDYVFPAITGWTLLGEAYANGTVNDANVGVYYKIMSSTVDTTVTITGPGGAADASIGLAHVFRGTHSTPIDVYTAGTHNATGTGTGAVNPAAITPATAGAIICVVGALANPAGAVLTTGGDLSTATNHFRTGTSPDTSDISIGFGIKIDWTSGAFDPAAWGGGGTRAAGDSWAAMTFSLRTGFSFPPARSLNYALSNLIRR